MKKQNTIETITLSEAFRRIQLSEPIKSPEEWLEIFGFSSGLRPTKTLIRHNLVRGLEDSLEHCLKSIHNDKRKIWLSPGWHVEWDKEYIENQEQSKKEGTLPWIRIERSLDYHKLNRILEEMNGQNFLGTSLTLGLVYADRPYLPDGRVLKLSLGRDLRNNLNYSPELDWRAFAKALNFKIDKKGKIELEGFVRGEYIGGPLRELPLETYEIKKFDGDEIPKVQKYSLIQKDISRLLDTISTYRAKFQEHVYLQPRYLLTMKQWKGSSVKFSEEFPNYWVGPSDNFSVFDIYGPFSIREHHDYTPTEGIEINPLPFERAEHLKH